MQPDEHADGQSILIVNPKLIQPSNYCCCAYKQFAYSCVTQPAVAVPLGAVLRGLASDGRLRPVLGL